jgi:hypothetical protein
MITGQSILCSKFVCAMGRYEEVVRTERYEWHPDRFCKVAESVRDEIITKATVLFQMLEALPRE